MRKLILSIFMAALFLSHVKVNADDNYARFRVDCRFYDDDIRYCYASAIYKMNGNDPFDIQYGVGCNYQTIFNDRGILLPESTLADCIRPRTSAIPKVEITPQGSLRTPGTYTAKLEIARGRIKDGQCYVRYVHEADPYTPLLFIR